MPLSKIQAESMNLADTYAFTGTVSGAGGGKLLQTVVSNQLTTWEQSASGNSWSDINPGSGVWEATITPSATNSVIIVSLYFGFIRPHTANGAYGGAIRIQRKIASGSYGNVTDNFGAGSGSSWRGLCMTSQEAAGEYKQGLACPPLVDTSHNTTSVLTYKPQIIGHSSGYGTHRINSGHSAENSGGYATRVISRMILEERTP